MKTYYGNYLGLVINSSDPEYRGRIQVFVPHIMPAIYEGWNKEGADIQITCVGSNIPEGLTPEIHTRLVKILPWAEAASPIIGASAPGNLFSEIVAGVKSAAGAVAEGVNNFFSQDPSSEPINTAGGTPTTISGELGALYTEASQYTGSGELGQKALKGFQTGQSQSACGRGTIAVVGAMTGDRAFQTGSAGGNARDFSMNGGQSLSSRSGSYLPKQPLPANYSNDPSQWQPGDVVACDSSGFGHIQTYTGVSSKPWTSDFAQTKPTVGGNYSGCALHRATPETQNKIKAKLDSLYGQGASQALGNEHSTPSNEASSENPLTKPDGTLLNEPKVPEQGSIQPTPGAGAIEGGTFSGGGTASGIDTSNMSPAFKAQYERVLKSMEGSKFDPNTTGKPIIPNDGATYGIKTGSKEEWAHFFTRNASVESSFNPNTAADINGKRQGTLTSFGLYQMGNTQFNRHGGGNIYNPDDATKAYINYAEEMYFGNTYRSGGQNVIGGRSSDGKWLGLAAGYGPIRRISTGNPNTNEKQLLAENISNSEKQTGNYTGTVSNPTASPSSMNVVNNTDSYGRTPIMNTNDMANGLFAYPNPGAMVWVFFREGNPLYPVYFAASYSSKEWSSAYRGSSPAIGYYNDGKKVSRATNFKPDQSGGLYTKFESNLEDTTGIQEKASVMLYHKGGSNVTFDNGIDFYHSHFARRDEVEQDRFVITKGYKEEWVEGDDSKNVKGDLLIKVGKFDKESMDALQELAKISAETNKQLTQSS